MYYQLLFAFYVHFIHQSFLGKKGHQWSQFQKPCLYSICPVLFAALKKSSNLFFALWGLNFEILYLLEKYYVTKLCSCAYNTYFCKAMYHF